MIKTIIGINSSLWSTEEAICDICESFGYGYTSVRCADQSTLYLCHSHPNLLDALALGYAIELTWIDEEE